MASEERGSPHKKQKQKAIPSALVINDTAVLPPIAESKVQDTVAPSAVMIHEDEAVLPPVIDVQDIQEDVTVNQEVAVMSAVECDEEESHEVSSPDYEEASPNLPAELGPFLEEEIAVELNEDIKNKHLPTAEYNPDVYVVNMNERMHLDYAPPVSEEEDVQVDDIISTTTNHNYANEDVEDEPYIIPDPVASIIEEETVTFLTNEEEENEDDKCSSELYAGTSKKLGFVLLMICSLSIRFKLSDEAVSYVISIIAMLLPPGNNMIKSVYALKDHLKKIVSFPAIHYLCSFCGTHVEKQSKNCSNPYCLKDLTQPGAIGYFIQHSVINQLQLMCKRTSFLEKVRSHRFKHFENNTENSLKDVYDGSNYKEAFSKGFLSDPNAISFSLNTDGVQIFKSSAVSMWPVYMMINEIPINERKLKENVLYYGLWISSRKPMMWSYLKPLHEEICRLEDGVKMKDCNGEEFTMKATILNCVCDLPARCMVSNSMQFNGEYGCWFCLQPGQTYTTTKGGHVRTFPFQANDPKGPQRTTQNLQDDVNNVIKNIHENKKKYIVRGIKGPFWFMFLKHFNVINGFVIDYMHGVCAGVMKLLMVLWFDKIHKDEAFSIFTSVSLISNRLKSICSNLHITRPPRSLDDIKHWKTSEFRNFLFLWSLPVLFDVLPEAYYVHYCLFVKAIYNLSKEGISETELQNAEMCLFKFVENFENLYSARFLTMNCHQLLHITDCVRANGPLFVNNCFVFEDLNGYVLKHIHGPTGVETQIINAVTKMQALPSMLDLYVEKGSSDEAFINVMLKPNYIHDGTCIEDGIFLLGQTYKKVLSNEEFLAVSDIITVFSPSVTEYRRIFSMKMACPVYGTAHGRLNKRNQSVVKFYEGTDITEVYFGVVKTFIQVENNEQDVFNFALVYPFSTTARANCHKITSQHAEIKCILLTSILKVCNIIDVGPETCITEFPNCREKD